MGLAYSYQQQLLNLLFEAFCLALSEIVMHLFVIGNFMMTISLGNDFLFCFMLQVSSIRLPRYQDVSRSWSEPLAASDVELQQTPNRPIIQDTNTEYDQPHVTSCSSNHPYLHDVPFILSPCIDRLTEDTYYTDCLPHLDLSELTYDFTVEHQILSQALLTHYGSKENDVACDDDNSSQFQEEHLIQQFGQQAVVAQDMFDFIGIESKGNQCSGAQDLMSF